MTEPENIHRFKEWLTGNGGKIHPDLRFEADDSGFSVIAAQDIPPESTVISCPFSLTVTPELSTHALLSLFKTDHTTVLDSWSERQLICTYLCMHWIADSPEYVLACLTGRVPRSHPGPDLRYSPALLHTPYLSTLPSADKLRTPLHFTPAELDALRGSNLHGATLDRQRELQAEWAQCQTIVAAANEDWGLRFTWYTHATASPRTQYLAAATYLSSRAFPSTLLSSSPSLVSTPDSYPVLLPGVDSLNHARAQPVSWVVSGISGGDTNTDTESSDLAVSLLLHSPTPRGAELLNNYGPKPNAELVLGYGFALPSNPDDTIVLKIGGAPGSGALAGGRWEVGRGAQGAGPLWDAILTAVCEGAEEEEEPDVDDELCAADMLLGMARNLLERLPRAPQPDEAAGIRADVARMIGYYLEGQRDILQSLMHLAEDKTHKAEEAARALGLEVVDEGEDEDEE
ncbi:hypothetical protein CERSUDRAFT_107074 [Gelatoporia subvermispora B]|uniref:Uncharacterized protein n=1 Tax=Ceriporiopsis subvermispora (strain B) TaxID=914234 RepID=M2QSP0_CERS8|nr:hypothetical protein CERSUDRAFT_107074 [Gelatoporia subvermispora B]